MDPRLLRTKLIPRDPSTAPRSSPSSPLVDPSAAAARLGLSPLRGRKSFTSESFRKPRQSNEDSLLRGRWPSSSSKKPSSTLADHLGNESPSGFSDRRGSAADGSTSLSAAGPQLLTRTRSCSERKEEEEQGGKISKENRPFGSSMRYIGKLKFPKSSSKPDSIQPGRMSVDESALANRRKMTDSAVDFPSWESDRSDSTKGLSPKIPRSRNKDSCPPSVDMTPSTKRSAAIRRAGSLTGMTAWALSPARRSNSPPLPPPPTGAAADGGGTPSRSFSSLRPASPEKSKKAGNIISIGLDLFRRKSGSASNKTRPSSPVLVMGDVGHRLRMLHNCLIQWRFVNARTSSVHQTRTSISENKLVYAWAEIAKLQASVMQKRVQVQREKLNLKLNSLLSWQMRSLEGWGDAERHHTSALSTTQNCLQAAVCRLPLVDRAKADPQLLSIRFRQATNLTATIKATIVSFASAAQNAVPLLAELAQVVAEERSMLEECVEMLRHVSSLQVQEESLRCHLVQLKSSHQQSSFSTMEIL